MLGVMRSIDVVITLTVAAFGCQRRANPVDALNVEMSAQPIVADGSWHEASWNDRAVHGVFTSFDPTSQTIRAEPARPYSEIRFLRDATQLWIGLYAADEDLRSTDEFEVQVGGIHLTVHPDGKATIDGHPQTVRVDTDGTIDNPSDFDEEWVIEVPLPLTAVGLTPGGGAVAVDARRCDVTKAGERRCGAWRGAIAIKPASRLP